MLEAFTENASAIQGTERNSLVMFSTACCNYTALGVVLVRLGWSTKNSLEVLSVQLSVVNTLDLIP